MSNEEDLNRKLLDLLQKAKRKEIPFEDFKKQLHDLRGKMVERLDSEMTKPSSEGKFEESFKEAIEPKVETTELVEIEDKSRFSRWTKNMETDLLININKTQDVSDFLKTI